MNPPPVRRDLLSRAALAFAILCGAAGLLLVGGMVYVRMTPPDPGPWWGDTYDPGRWEETDPDDPAAKAHYWRGDQTVSLRPRKPTE